MTGLLENPLYAEDIRYVAGLGLPWEKLAHTKVLVAGAGGLLGSFLTDVLMWRNENAVMDCTIYAIGRDAAAAQERFAPYWGSPFFTFLAQDITDGLECGECFDYILHLASNTHPVAYATQPISTIAVNVMGTDNLLRYAAAHGAKRFLFASSNEVYGQNRGDTEFFDERYCGYLDSNTLRAGYPEGKRCGEALCQAYRHEKGVDIVIPRFTRSYGPTLLPSDTKAMSQFLRKAAAGEDIVLKSKGSQYYSYTYVADAVAGMLTVLLKGADGEAYNVADGKSDVMLRDLAAMIAGVCGTKVVFEQPDAIEKAGYSTATKARLDGGKLKKLGWNMRYDIKTGITRTVAVLRG